VVTERLRIGIIGCGALGVVHAQRFDAMPDAEVIALSDPNPAAMAHAAAALSRPPRVQAADYREILDAGLDAVCIASPDSFHVPQALDALAADLHVLCEKPLTLDPDALEAVIASSREVGKVVSMTYPRRYDGGLRAMRREIQSGKWGRVKAVAILNCEEWVTSNAGTWRHDPAICPGGFFYDACGHQLDTMFWVTGLEAVSVRAEKDNGGTPVPMVVWGTARLTGNVPFSFSFVGTSKTWREHVVIYCEGCDFSLDNFRTYWSREGKMVPIEPVEPGENADDAFLPLVRGEGQNWAPPEELWPILRFTRAALTSAEKGEEVVLSAS
jgi:predicted dehydrogenase